jgi:hypothetical protein
MDCFVTLFLAMKDPNIAQKRLQIASTIHIFGGVMAGQDADH